VHHSIDAVLFMKNSISECSEPDDTMDPDTDLDLFDEQDNSSLAPPDNPNLLQVATPLQLAKKKSRRRANNEGYWLPVCSISNFYKWEAAVKMWHLWLSGRIRGITNRIRYGLCLYKYYQSKCQWNDGKNLLMLILPYKLDAIKQWLINLDRDPRQANIDIRDFIQSLNEMPVVAVSSLSAPSSSSSSSTSSSTSSS